jgi:uncharacterized damage-inducible protein DinB
MSAAAITFDELLADNEISAAKWNAWFQANPAALEVPSDIYNSGTVRGVLKHLWAVELRHSQRLLSKEVIAYDAIPSGSLNELFAIHAQAIENLRAFLAAANDATLNEPISIQTVSAGTVQCSRRKLFAHVLLHSTRHWAQLTTLLRENGFKTEWPKDLLFSEALR